METMIHISDLKPAKCTAKNIGGYVWLEFDQGGDIVSLHLPSRMEAVAAMIADAFNSHMNAGPIARVAQGEKPEPMFPIGGALSAKGALAVAAAALGTAPGDIMELPTGDGPIDLAAVSAVERRDLP